MESIFNVGLDLHAWLKILAVLTVLVMWTMAILTAVAVYKSEKRRWSRLIWSAGMALLFTLWLFFTFSPTGYTLEQQPVEGHSLNKDVMQALDPMSVEELDSDAVESMDEHLKVFREDSAFNRELKESEEETDRELKRLLNN